MALNIKGTAMSMLLAQASKRAEQLDSAGWGTTLSRPWVLEAVTPSSIFGSSEFEREYMTSRGTSATTGSVKADSLTIDKLSEAIRAVRAVGGVSTLLPDEMTHHDDKFDAMRSVIWEGDILHRKSTHWPSSLTAPAAVTLVDPLKKLRDEADRAEREAKRAEKASAEVKYAEARFETVMAVRTRFPHLQGTALSRTVSLSPSIRDSWLIRDGLNEILHKANFHRAKYGYSNHYGYSSHLANLASVWSAELELDLISHIELTDVAESERRVLAASDSPDMLPDGLLEDLLGDLGEGSGLAIRGIW